MAKKLTTTQAYKAMYVFIRNYYYRKGKPDELAILLGDIQLLREFLGKPQASTESNEYLETMDPASWTDWLEAIDTVISE